MHLSLKIMEVQIHPSWKEVLKEEFKRDYFRHIVLFIKTELAAGKIVYPRGPLIFNAFDKTPFDEVKVVILGQDPYHNPNQAHGLSFSVPDGQAIPPSLLNIFKELKNDLGIDPPKSGNLEKWAERGVLLLNTTLTVRKNEPMSHSQCGWTAFTDAVITQISNKKKGVVFLLWGNAAQQKQALIDETKHFVLKAAHPSPLSASRGFMGCRHFSKTNQLLTLQGIEPVDWKL